MLASIRLVFAVLGTLAPEIAGRLAVALFARPQRHARPTREHDLIARGAPVALPEGLRATAWGAGPTVLLVHGWEGRGAQLGALVDPLVAAGYRVVALDAPAHGDSTGRSTTLPDFAHAIELARQSVGPLAALVGHSFGGFASLFAVSRGTSTERLVMIASPSSVPDVLQDFARQINLPRRAFPSLVRALERRARAPLASFALEAFASAITVPILIIHDREDREVPYSNGIRLAGMLPGSRLESTSGLGHRRILYAPDVVRSVVDFIEEGSVMRQSLHSAREDA